jgi:hypothetical protein
MEVKYNTHTQCGPFYIQCNRIYVCTPVLLCQQPWQYITTISFYLQCTNLCTFLATHFSINLNLYTHNRHIWCVEALKIVL